MNERIITGRVNEQDNAEASLRPQTLADFTGQQQAKKNLRVFIEAAKGRGDARNV